MNKTCAKCGNQVDSTIKFCPNCGNNQFIEQKAEVTVQTSKPTLIHKLFYWKYDNGYALAKSKLAGITIFITLSSMSFLAGAPPAIILVGLIFGMIVFLLGFALHTILSHPNKTELEYNDYGLIPDLIHLLFYWQNKKTGQYVLSKTKIISHLIFLLFAVIATTAPLANLFVVIVVGLFFEIPSFIIGYAIHKLTNPYPVNPNKKISKPKEVPKPKEAPKPIVNETPEQGMVPEYAPYKQQVIDLKNSYFEKEKHTRELIEKRFTPPQLTYTRFISVVDKSTELFNHQSDSALSIIKLASDYSPKIENEIKSKINILNEITQKLDDLTNELVLTMDDSSDEEVSSLFEDMSDLINSVKDYE